MNDIRNKVATALTYLVLLIILIGGTLMMCPDFRRSQSLKRQNAELQERIEAKKAEIEKLLENQRRFRTDPDFVESIARQNHRVFPGELIFIYDRD